MMDDLSELIDEFKLDFPVEVERYSLGTYTDGIYSAAPAVILLMEPVVIHPTSAEILRQLPEGLRTSKAISIYAKEMLRTAKAGEYEADIVRYQGFRYVIQQVENWNDNGAFYKAIATKVEQ